jgi:L-ascorbate metabolism protein UlaG (beta-lactamase superfamily)
MQIKFRWLGNAGFEFDLGNSILLVDPYLTRPGQSRVCSGRTAPDSTAIKAHIYRCDNILVTHTHFDHFMDVPDIALQTGAAMHGSYNTCELAKKLGVSEKQTHLIKAGDEFTVGNMQVKVIPAAHPWIPGYTNGQLNKNLKPPLRLRDYRMDTCLSFLVIYQGRRLLIWSSTHTAYSQQADMLICRAVSSQKWYTQMIEKVQPRLIIPCHWDDMFQPLSKPPQPFFSPPRLAMPPLQRIDLREFERKIKKVKPGCRVLVPERFKQYPL